MVRNDACPAIVLGSDITALGVLRSLRRAGIAAAYPSDNSDIASWSRGFTRLNGYSADALTAPALKQWLESTDLAAGVLMPCSDAWVQSVSRLDDRFCERFRRWTPAAPIVDMVIDKNQFRATLESLSIPHPRTFELKRDVSRWQVPEDIFEAAFLKPHQSTAHLEYFGTKAVMVNNLEEAKREAELRWIRDIDLMIQEYIPGPPSQHYFVDGYRTRDGSSTQYLARQRLEMYPPDFGNSSDMVTVPLSSVDPAIATLEHFFANTDFHGVFSAEFKQDIRDEKFKILEINCRPWWFVDFADRVGLHVCKAAYLDARGIDVPDAKPYRLGARCAHPYYDWQAYRHQDKQSVGSVLTLVIKWLRSYQPIFSWSDPMPSIVDSSRMFFGTIRRRIGRALRRDRG